MLAGGDAGEFGAAESGDPDDGVVGQKEGEGVTLVAGDVGVGEEVLEFLGGVAAEGNEAVARLAGADGENGGKGSAGEGLAGGGAGGVDDEFGVDLGEGKDGGVVPMPVALGEGGGGGLQAQAVGI